jgi:CBS domain containing-hemolysin-like protein
MALLTSYILMALVFSFLCSIAKAALLSVTAPYVVLLENKGKPGTLEDIIEALLGLEIVDEGDEPINTREQPRRLWRHRARNFLLDFGREKELD